MPESQLLIHRIVEKRGSMNAAQLFSKSDAHPNADGVVQQRELLGRVVRIYRHGQRFDLHAPRQLAWAYSSRNYRRLAGFGIRWQSSPLA